MTQAQAIQAFLDRMTVLYGPPDTSNIQAFMAEYRDLLSGYAASIITSASDYIRSHHQYRNWPTPGEVHAALKASAPPPKRIDWDAVEAERREGWRFDDLRKVRGVDDAARARVQAMFEEFKGNMAQLDDATRDEVDWAAGQSDQFEGMQRNRWSSGLHLARPKGGRK